MACSRATILLLAIVVSCCGLLSAQAADCNTELAGLIAGCSSAVTNVSSTPDQKACCTPLDKVLTTPDSFQCLCAASSSPSTEAVFKNALLLPQKCNLTITVSQDNCTKTSNGTSSTGSSPSAGVINTLSWSHVPAFTLFGVFFFLM